MTSMSNFNIAVIGDEDLVNGLRLAGVTRCYPIGGEQPGEEVRQVLGRLIGEPGVGIIALQEEYAQYVEDLITGVKESKSLIPLIIEIPSKYGTKYDNVTEYYKAYVRDFTGFDVEI